MRRIPALWIAVSLLVVACTGNPKPMYSGQPRPDAEVATLKGTFKATVIRVDGESVSGTAWALLPGRHEIVQRVRFYTSAPNMNWTVWTYCHTAWSAVAGGQYRSELHTRTETASGLGETVKMEVGVYDATGRLVAQAYSCSGERPPSNAG